MIEFENVKRILIFRLCCFGDIIMLTPVIEAVKKSFPDARIDLAASSWIGKLLPYIKHINKAIIYEGPFAKNIFRKIISTIKFILALRKNKYDLVFLAHRTSAYGLILKLAGIKFRLGFSESRFLTHSADYDEDSHFVDRHLKVLISNGIEVKNSALSLRTLKKRVEILRDFGISNGSLVIGIFPFGGSNPGTKMDIKRWGFSNYVELIRKISLSKPEIKVILFEGTLDDEKIGTIDLPANVSRHNIDPDLISACNIFISGDTGPLYMAEAFSVSTLSIFGPTDAGRVAPKSVAENTLHWNIWKKPFCAPCYNSVTAFDKKNSKYWRGDKFICYTGTHECIRSISVDEVCSMLGEMIAELGKQGKKS